MMDTLNTGDMKISWLNGGITRMDGGAMFGPVPKPLWEKRYPCNSNNQIELPTEPILIQRNGMNIMIDAGIGKNRLSEKQKKIFGITEESTISDDLNVLGLTPADIDYVLMTHLHYDHMTGLVSEDNGVFTSVFPKAKIIVEESEWIAIKQPTKRSKGTYWKENWEPIEKQVVLFKESYTVLEGVDMFKTSGHSSGHSIVKITNENEVFIHLGDILPTHAHQNALWITAYDDYPLASIAAKETWIRKGIENRWTFLFYHDAFYRAVRFNSSDSQIDWYLERSKTPEVKMK